MRKRALCAGLMTSAIVLVGAQSAFAAPTSATLVLGVLTVTGDATAETYTVSTNAANVEVTGPAPAIAPVGCTAAAGVLTCPSASVTALILNGAGGDDTLTDSRVTNVNDTLNGDAGNDSVDSTGNAFTGTRRLNGNDGNDALGKNNIFGGGSQVVLDGGANEDTLNAGIGALSTSDTGGLGNDTFNGSNQFSDSFAAEPGSDIYNGGTRVPGPTDIVDDAATFQRNSAQDSITYGARSDAQTVSLDNVANDGSAGEVDNVGATIEDVTGGTGNDVLTAGSQAVNLSGGPEADFFGGCFVLATAGGGDDALNGGPSDDVLNGGVGSDSLAGNGGDDSIDDGDCTNAINPAPAAPALAPVGNDTLSGGDGNDNLFSDRGADNIIGGAGRDFASFSRPVPQDAAVTTPVASAGFTISLDDVANDGQTAAGEGDNVHSDVEDVQTSGRAADVVSGSAAANTISTGQGNDSIDPGAGPDEVFAGDGDDAINALDQTTDRVDCGKGIDTANVDLAGAQPTRADVTFDCENITGAAFGAVVPAIDTSKPKLKLTSKTVKAKTFKKNGRLPVKVTCSKACSLIGEAFTTRATIRVVSKSGQFKVGFAALKIGAAGKARTLNVKIAKKFLTKYKRQLRTKKQIRKGLSFIVSVTASDALGIQASANRTIKVRG